MAQRPAPLLLASLVAVAGAACSPAEDPAAPDLAAAAPDPTPPTRTDAPDVPKGALVLNEIHATNLTGLADEDGDVEDWVELRNLTDQPLDLSGAGLSVSKKDPFAFTFPPGAALRARGTLLVFASKKARAVWGRPLHAPFNIDSGADTVYLTSPGGALLDAAPATRTRRDVSLCRIPDGAGPLLHCAAPTPRTPNGGGAFPAMLAAPTASVPGGFYASPQRVTLSSADPGAQIRYTLDGSEPTAQSPSYGDPILVEGRSGQKNVYSLIPTSRTFYAPADGEVYKATVLRAAAFADGKLGSPVTTHSYFIDPDAERLYRGVPVASVVADPPQLFSQDSPRGIEVFGPSPGNAPWYPGANWWLDREVPASLELFAPDRSTLLRADFGAQISGGYSRNNAQKNLDVIFRDPYGVRSVSAPLFPSRAYSKFKRFRLRASGQEYGRSHIRDLLAHDLFRQGSPLDFADYAPAVAFLDGEYWGFIQLREKTTGDFLGQVHGVDDGAVDIIDIAVTPLSQVDHVEVRDGTRLAWDALRAYVAAHAAELQSDLGLIEALFDTENLTNWFAANQFMNNIDWPTNNVRAWRPREQDGRWRFILHDDDFTFGMSGTAESSLYKVIGNTSKIGSMMGILMKNPDFRTLYINTVADQLNSYFEAATLTARLDAIVAAVEPLMAEHYARFRPGGNTLPAWGVEVGKIRAFIQNREAAYVRNTQDYFGLGMEPRYALAVSVSDPAMGSVKVNTLDLSKRLLDAAKPWTGRYFPGVPITVRALPRPGFKLARWEGAAAGAAAAVTLSPSGDTALRAVFERDPAPPPPAPGPAAPPAGLRNLALGAAAAQSSTAGQAVAGLAVDGDVSGAQAAASVALTTAEPNAYWQVDLGEAAELWGVRIYNRGDCCADRLSNFHVFVSETDLSGRSYASLVGDDAVWKARRRTPFGDVLTLPVGRKGRYVRVQLAEGNALGLAEVQVLAQAAPAAPPRNLALGKRAAQSSTEGDAAPERAVDGDPDGGPAGGSIAQTRAEDAPFWQVDLGGRYPLRAVQVHGRSDSGARLSDLLLLVSDEPMDGRTLAELEGDRKVWKRAVAGPAGTLLQIPAETAGRHVRLQLRGAARSLALAEVVVLGPGVAR